MLDLERLPEDGRATVAAMEVANPDWMVQVVVDD